LTAAQGVVSCGPWPLSQPRPLPLEDCRRRFDIHLFSWHNMMVVYNLTGWIWYKLAHMLLALWNKGNLPSWPDVALQPWRWQNSFQFAKKSVLWGAHYSTMWLGFMTVEYVKYITWGPQISQNLLFIRWSWHFKFWVELYS
jgi:hypothetical protein